MLNRLRRSDDAERGWPGYLFGGRVRTSTLVLVIAFLAVWWLYDYHRDSTRSKRSLRRYENSRRHSAA